MIMTQILTPLQRKRATRDANFYKEYLELVAVPGSSRTAIVQVLMRKYGVSYTTAYAIIGRKGGQS